MVDERILLAGIDISGDNPQIAYWHSRANEPQMLEYDVTEELPDDVVQLAKWALAKLEAEYFNSIVVTLSSNNISDTISALRRSLKEAYPDTKLNFITRGESCAHYSLNQKKELRVNDVAFFDLSDTGLIYNRLHVSHIAGKAIAAVESRDCSSIVNLGLLENEEIGSALDESFKSLISELFEKQHISTVYLTGNGFVNEEWAKESLNMLCNKRRVFKGQSLYAIGACYFAAWGFFEVNDDYRLICEGRTAYETCMEVVYKEEKKEAVLVPAGKLWHEVDNTAIEGILSGDAKLMIIRRYALSREVKREEMILSDLKNYEDRKLRLGINVYMANDKELCVSVEDLGFGEFAPKSGIKIEKILGNA